MRKKNDPFKPINTNDPEPLYLQVKKIITTRILEGTYKAGNAIPSELEMAKEFKLSVSTIRQALSIFVSEGVLERKQGKGTFITERKTNIRFLTWLGESPEGQRILRSLIEMINENLPSIHVEIIHSTYISLKKDFIRLLANGEAPDVVQITNFWTSYFLSMGAIEPLDELLSKQNLDNRMFEPDLAGGLINRKLYSVAWGLSPIVCAVNNEMLRGAEIERIPNPLSLKEFSNICTKIDSSFQARGKYSFGLACFGDEIDFLSVYPFLIAFGGGFNVNKYGLLLNTPENISAFEWLREFVNSHKVFISDIFTIRRLFAKGDIGIISDGAWIKFIIREHAKEDFDKKFTLFLNPTNLSKSSSWQYNHSLAIYSQSHNKQAAAKVIDLMTDRNAMSEYFYTQTGMLPVNGSQQSDPAFETPYFRVLKDQLENSRVLNAENPMFEKAMQLCKNAVHKILLRGVDIKHELEEKEYYLKLIYYD